MTCYRISADITLKSSTDSAKITTADNYLTNAVATSGITLSDDFYIKTVNGDGTYNFQFSIRYLTQGSRDVLKTNILNAIEDNIDPNYQSWMEIHECHHDETPMASCENQIQTRWGYT